MNIRIICISLFTIISLISCGQKEEPVKHSAEDEVKSVAAPLPDVGRVTKVTTDATGYGASAAAAITDAMKSAILQVNGATIETESIQAKLGLDLTDGKDTASLRAEAFAEYVTQRSGGAVTNFKVVEITEPKLPGGQYKVLIRADIAQFVGPQDKKIKVVVSPLHFDNDYFTIASTKVPASRVAEDIREQVSTALLNTGRYSVLDRDEVDAIERELDLIKDGKAPRSEAGKIGQAVTADIVWAGTITSLSYNKYSRQLRTSNRELVSYSGGWGLNEKLINVATRQIMVADALKGSAPEMAATTMSTGVNSEKVLQDIVSDMVTQIVTSIISRTYPITVVSIDGTNVVLSQGGKSLKVGSRYALVTMGKELKDPQTGESLGRMENDCCEVVIDKVSEKVSYGHVDNLKISIDNLPAGGLQVRQLVENVATVEPELSKNKDKQDKPQKGSSVSKSNEEVDDSIQASKEDGKW